MKEDLLNKLNVIASQLNQIAIDISFTKTNYIEYFISIKSIIIEIYKVAYQSPSSPKEIINICEEISDVSYEICNLNELSIYNIDYHNDLIEKQVNKLKKLSSKLIKSNIITDSILYRYNNNNIPIKLSIIDTIDILYSLCQHFHYYFSKECNILKINMMDVYYLFN